MPSESPRANRYHAMAREALIDEVLKLDELIERMSRQAGVYCWDWFPDDRRTVNYRPSDGEDDWGLRSQRTDLEYLEDLHPQDRDRVLRVYEQPADYEVEYRVRSPEGDWSHVRETALTFFDENGHWVRQEGTIQDITERKQAEHKLRQREAWLNHAQMTARIGYWVWYGEDISDWSLEGAVGGRPPLLSQQFREIFGIDDDGETWSAWRVHSDDEAWTSEALAAADQARHRYDIEYRITDDSGAVKVVHEVGDSSHDPDSDQTVWIGIVQDITQQKQTEEALRRSEDRFALAVHGSQSGIWDWDIENGEIYYSPRLLEITDFPRDRERIPAGRVLPSIHSEDRDRYKAALAAHLKGQTPYFECEMRVLTKSDAIRWILDRGLALRDEGGRAYRMAGSVIDVTQRREAEEALRDERNFNSTIFDTADALIVVLDRKGRIVTFNKKCEDLTGYSFSEVEQRVFWEILLTPEDAALVKESYRNLISDRFVSRRENHWVAKDGTKRLISWRNSAILDAVGAVQFIVAIGLDVTELKQAEEALRLSEQRFRAFMDNSPDALSLKDSKGHYLLGNREFEKLTGLSSAELQGMTIEEVFPGDSDLHAELREHERKVQESKGVIRRERQGRYPDGSLRHFSVTKFPVLDADGQVVAIGTTNHDVTELKRAEDQLRQSQKMEAVGQLTGGVAHDFNNLLGAVIGNLELARESLGSGSEATPFVQNAMRASNRGAALTQRLLAFSRKQPLRPEPVDANKLSRGMSELLRRSLGETIDIEVVGDAGLWQCLVDPSQLENVLLNLAINARDAMPSGGKLTIEASNARLSDDYAATQDDVKPGQYVLVAITDTGWGMSADVMEHAFEPFFTTKDVGKGTGLGLSMVYGFVKQSGGHVTIYSEVGEGTTVKLYLPRYYGADDALGEWRQPEELVRGKGETVLVVEDDSEVRALLRQFLRSLGYAVLEAASAPAALDVFADAPHVDLLLTDIVLPGGMNGRQLAEELTQKHPVLAVLYTSGYSENAVIHHGRLDPGIELLQKPFLKADLSRATAKALKAAAGQPKG